MNNRVKVRVSALCAAAVAVCCSSAAAHYLWVTVEKPNGDQAVTNIYFEGGPGPGDGQYLDPFVERGTTYVRTLESAEPTRVKMKDVTKDKKRWLTGNVPAAKNRSIDSYGKWGVYRYGKTDVLLHYYARRLDVSGQDGLKQLARAEKMDLDVVPQVDGKETTLKVLWQGKPAAGAPVYVRGPKGFKQNLKTDDKGMVSFETEAAGNYTFRTSVEEPDKSGTDDGKEYSKVRHSATLAMNLPVAQ